MNVQRLILFTLGSTSLLSQSACIGTRCGNNDFKLTNETQIVTKQSFEEAMEASGVERSEDVPCLAVCEAAINILEKCLCLGIALWILITPY